MFNLSTDAYDYRQSQDLTEESILTAICDGLCSSNQAGAPALAVVMKSIRGLGAYNKSIIVENFTCPSEPMPVPTGHMQLSKVELYSGRNTVDYTQDLTCVARLRATNITIFGFLYGMMELVGEAYDFAADKVKHRPYSSNTAYQRANKSKIIMGLMRDTPYPRGKNCHSISMECSVPLRYKAGMRDTTGYAISSPQGVTRLLIDNVECYFHILVTSEDGFPFVIYTNSTKAEAISLSAVHDAYYTQDEDISCLLADELGETTGEELKLITCMYPDYKKLPLTAQQDGFNLCKRDDIEQWKGVWNDIIRGTTWSGDSSGRCFTPRAIR